MRRPSRQGDPAFTPGEVIRCPRCGTPLGLRTVDAVVIRHRMREIVATSVVSIRCDGCGILVGAQEPLRASEGHE